jgi:hypothetical protein
VDLKAIGCENVDWIQVAQDRGQWLVVVNMVMNLRFLKKGGKFVYELSDYQLLMHDSLSRG